MPREFGRAVRRLLARPLYSLVIIGTLALGFGANTAIFSIVRGVLIKSLPYGESGRLVLLRNQFPQSGDTDLGVSLPEIEDWKLEEDLFTSVAGVRTGEQNVLWTLEADGRTEKHEGAWVTWDFFDVVDVDAVLGRTFTVEEGIAGQHRVMVLSNAFWRARFGADPSIVGTSLKIRGDELEVVGVAPAGFNTDWNTAGARAVDFWVVDPANPEAQRRWWGFNTVARLAPDVTLDQARGRAQVVADGFADLFPDVYRSREEHEVTLEPLQARITGQARMPLVVLFITVGAVLLIACMNVSNLLLVRADGARREVALRSALGASRKEMSLPFLQETGILTTLGAAAGILIAYGTVAAVRQMDLGSIPRLESIQLDIGVLAFTGAVALVTGLLMGLMPALKTSRVDPAEMLKDGGRGSGRGLSNSRLGRSLVIGEVAMALTLTIAAGLLLQTFRNLTDIGVGIEPEGVVSMRVDFPPWQYPEMDEVGRIHEQILERAAAVPGLQVVASAHAEHPLRLNGRWYFGVDGRDADPEDTNSMVGIRVVSSDYLETMNVPLIAGRTFDSRERVGEPFRILVNKSLVERRFPGEDPIGKRLNILNAGQEMPPFEIIGVVGDVRNEGIRESVRETLLLPLANPAFARGWTRHMTVHARTVGNAALLAGPLRAAIAEVAPTLTVSNITTLDSVVAETVAGPKMVASLVGGFAALALILSGLGIYGVTSYSVSQRTQEIGVRIALGAGTGQVEGLVVGQGLRLGLAGIALGTVLALAGARAMTSLLYEVPPAHVPTFAGTAVLLLALVVGASYLPARRASRIEPVQALRAE